MPVTHTIGLLFLLQVAGCVTISTTPATGALQGGTVVVEHLSPDAAQGRAGVAERSQNPAMPGGTVIVERLPPLPETAPVVVETPVTAEPPAKTAPPVIPAPATDIPPVTATPITSATVANKPAAKAPAKVIAPPVSAQLPQKPQAAAHAPPLALTVLEQQLKDTDAIGLFTKIALKNQIDDLLKRFKTHHEDGRKAPLTQLRQSYDQLLLKVNDVLKNGDPSLAGEIMGSREAIWGVLSDPVKFAKL